MNERLKELAEQAGMQNTLGCFWQSSDDELERFAELVRQDELEACVWLVEGGNHLDPKAPEACGAQTVAQLIRPRGNRGKN